MFWSCNRSRWSACSIAWSSTGFGAPPGPKDRRANRLFLTRAGRQLVDDLDSLRDAIATDVLQEIPDAAIGTSLETLRDIKERIKGLGETPGDVAAK